MPKKWRKYDESLIILENGDENGDGGGFVDEKGTSNSFGLWISPNFEPVGPIFALGC